MIGIFVTGDVAKDSVPGQEDKLSCWLVFGKRNPNV